jgi:hypothetical protein
VLYPQIDAQERRIHDVQVFDAPICCKEGTLNSVVKGSVALYNFIRGRTLL